MTHGIASARREDPPRAAERETMAEAAAVLRKLDIEPLANPVEALLQPSFSTATAR